MADYKEMYRTLFRASEQAIRTLVAAQQACEEMYLDQPEGNIVLLADRGDGEQNE